MIENFFKSTMGKTYFNETWAFRALFKDKPVGLGGAFTDYSYSGILAKNKDLGIALCKFDVNIYPGFGDGMLYENGIFIVRKDGTAKRGIQQRWRNSAHIWPTIKSAGRMQSIDGDLLADVHFSDGSKKNINFGAIEAQKAYFVFRTNETYNSVLHSIKKEIQSEDLQITILGFYKGSEIVENDEIRNIPRNAVIFTDQTTLNACSSLQNRTVERLDTILDSYYGSNQKSGAKFMSAKNQLELTNPEKIFVYEQSIADHPEKESGIKWQNEELYSKYLQKELAKTYDIPEKNIIFTKNKEELEDASYDDLIVIDRHASNDFSERTYNRSLKLPLYENFTDGSNKKDLHKGIARELINKIMTTDRTNN